MHYMPRKTFGSTGSLNVTSCSKIVSKVITSGSRLHAHLHVLCKKKEKGFFIYFYFFTEMRVAHNEAPMNFSKFVFQHLSQQYDLQKCIISKMWKFHG